MPRISHARHAHTSTCDGSSATDSGLSVVIPVSEDVRPQRTRTAHSFLGDLSLSLRHPHYWTYSTWLQLGLKYRRTTLGPIWMAVGPAFFVVFLGYLYSQVNTVAPEVFVPHLAVGYVAWTLISGYVVGGSTVYIRRRSEILQGNMRLTDLSLAASFETFLTFLHQAVVIVGVYVFFGMLPPPSGVFSLLGLLLLFLTGFCVMTFLGIIGARYRDIVEVISSVMRIMFFITPIIWIPKDGAGGFLGAYLVFNPFYHYLEMVRAPLLGTPISPLSFAVVAGLSVVILLATLWAYRTHVRGVPLWVL